MSVRVMADVWADAPVEGGELLVLLALADWADDDGVCWPGTAAIAKKSRLSVRHVKRVIDALVERELVELLELGAGSRTSRYRVTARARGGDTVAPPAYPPVVSSIPPGGDIRYPPVVTPASPDPSSDPSDDPSVVDLRARVSAADHKKGIALAAGVGILAPPDGWIEGMIAKHGMERVAEAFGRAKEATGGRASSRYVEAILERWQEQGASDDERRRARPPRPRTASRGGEYADRFPGARSSAR